MEKILQAEQKPNILVIGDLMVDHYLWGSCNRVAPDAPVPVVDIKEESSVLGGAGNVIDNLVALGANVGVLSVVGDDDVAEELKYLIDATDAKSYLIEQKGRKTSKKTKVMSGKTQMLRFDHESKNNISFDAAKQLYAKFQQIINAYDTILFSDYKKGVLTKLLIKDIIKYANAVGKKVLVDPRGRNYSKYKGADLIVPNKKEAQAATEIEIDSDDRLKDALKELQNIAATKHSIITLSENGIALLKDNEVIIKPTIAQEVYDITGSSDMVLSALGFALSIEDDLEVAVEFANIAASLVIRRVGNASVTLQEIEDYQKCLC